MSEADRKKGVVGWSSGNHAQGLAEAARLMGMKATIVMPADAPALKVANTRASGAEVVLARSGQGQPRGDRPRHRQQDRRHGRAALRPSLDPDRPGHGGAGDRRAGQGGRRHARRRRRALLGRRAVDRHRARGEGAQPQRPACMPASRRASTTSRARSPPAPSRRTTSSRARSAMPCWRRRRATSPSRWPRSSSGRASSSPTTKCSTPWRLAFREFKLVVEPGGAVALAAALTGKLPVKGRAVAVVCSGRQCRPRDLRPGAGAARRHEPVAARPSRMADHLLAQPDERAWSAPVSATRVAPADAPLLRRRDRRRTARCSSPRRSCCSSSRARVAVLRRLRRLPLVRLFRPQGAVLLRRHRRRPAPGARCSSWTRESPSPCDAVFRNSIVFSDRHGGVRQPGHSRWARCWVSARSRTC